MSKIESQCLSNLKIADIAKKVSLLEKRLGIKRPISVIWNKRLRKNLAFANFDEWRIEISPREWDMFSELTQNEIIAHEVAHFHAGYDSGHGEKWRNAMRLLGYRKNNRFVRIVYKAAFA